MTNRTLVKYVSNKKRGRIGAVVAYPVDGEIWYGWSLCRKDDIFNKQTALDLAIERAIPIAWLVRKSLRHQVPQSVARELAAMTERAEHYYKTV